MLVALGAAPGCPRATDSIDVASAAAVAARSTSAQRFRIAGGEASGTVVTAFRSSFLEPNEDMALGVPRAIYTAPDPEVVVMRNRDLYDLDFFNRVNCVMNPV